MYINREWRTDDALKRVAILPVDEYPVKAINLEDKNIEFVEFLYIITNQHLEFQSCTESLKCYVQMDTGNTRVSTNLHNLHVQSDSLFLWIALIMIKDILKIHVFFKNVQKFV